MPNNQTIPNNYQIMKDPLFNKMLKTAINIFSFYFVFILTFIIIRYIIKWSNISRHL